MFSQEAFHHYWRNRHPDVVTRLPGIRRYVQNDVTAVLKGEPIWDGIAEVSAGNVGRNTAVACGVRSRRVRPTSPWLRCGP